MKTLQVIEKRRSIREYKDRSLKGKDFDYLNEVLSDLPAFAAEMTLESYFIEDGEQAGKVLAGKVGYHGVLITAPHYLLLLAKDDEDHYKGVGYVGEHFSLKLGQEDIGTCWIEVNDSEGVKEALGIESGLRALGLIALGYPKTESKISKMFPDFKKGSLSPLTDVGYPNIDSEFVKEPVSSREDVSSYVYQSSWGNPINAEELRKQGLDQVYHYMRFAPSWGNRQPWKFILDGDQVVLAIARADEVADEVERIDAGIVMLYFEVAMHGVGISGSWSLTPSDNQYQVPEEDYFIAGIYKI